MYHHHHKKSLCSRFSNNSIDMSMCVCSFSRKLQTTLDQSSSVWRQGSRTQTVDLCWTMVGLLQCVQRWLHPYPQINYPHKLLSLLKHNVNDISCIFHNYSFFPISFSTYIFHQLPFWNGCDEDDRCVPNLVLQSNTDLLDRRCVILESHSYSKHPRPKLVQHFCVLTKKNKEMNCDLCPDFCVALFVFLYLAPGSSVGGESILHGLCVSSRGQRLMGSVWWRPAEDEYWWRFNWRTEERTLTTHSSHSLTQRTCSSPAWWWRCAFIQAHKTQKKRPQKFFMGELAGTM